MKARRFFYLMAVAALVTGAAFIVYAYRGEMGERDPWQTEGGRVTEPVLQALGISYHKLSDPATVAHEVDQAQTLAQSSLRPVALLLTRDLMWEE